MFLFPVDARGWSCARSLVGWSLADRGARVDSAGRPVCWELWITQRLWITFLRRHQPAITPARPMYSGCGGTSGQWPWPIFGSLAKFLPPSEFHHLVAGDIAISPPRLRRNLAIARNFATAPNAARVRKSATARKSATLTEAEPRGSHHWCDEGEVCHVVIGDILRVHWRPRKQSQSRDLVSTELDVSRRTGIPRE